MICERDFHALAGQDRSGLGEVVVLGDGRRIYQIRNVRKPFFFKFDMS